jgi:hypothetical protein
MFKVGDVVVIQSYEAVKTTLDRYGILKGESIAFDELMAAYCGDQAIVTEVLDSRGSPRLKLKGNHWVWHPYWLVPQMLDNRSVM